MMVMAMGGIGGLRLGLGWIELRLYCYLRIYLLRVHANWASLRVTPSFPPPSSSIAAPPPQHLTTPHDFKISAATRIAALVLPTHFCASSASWSKVIDSVIPGNVTGAYPVSLPGANSVFW
jgi:hypothetical protein